MSNPDAPAIISTAAQTLCASGVHRGWGAEGPRQSPGAAPVHPRSPSSPRSESGRPKACRSSACRRVAGSALGCTANWSPPARKASSSPPSPSTASAKPTSWMPASSACACPAGRTVTAMNCGPSASPPRPSNAAAPVRAAASSSGGCSGSWPIAAPARWLSMRTANCLPAGGARPRSAPVQGPGRDFPGQARRGGVRLAPLRQPQTGGGAARRSFSHLQPMEVELRQRT